MIVRLSAVDQFDGLVRIGDAQNSLQRRRLGCGHRLTVVDRDDLAGFCLHLAQQLQGDFLHLVAMGGEHVVEQADDFTTATVISPVSIAARARVMAARLFATLSAG